MKGERFLRAADILLDRDLLYETRVDAVKKEMYIYERVGMWLWGAVLRNTVIVLGVFVAGLVIINYWSPVAGLLVSSGASVACLVGTWCVAKFLEFSRKIQIIAIMKRLARNVSAEMEDLH